jgi:hypothetical protein
MPWYRFSVSGSVHAMDPDNGLDILNALLSDTQGKLFSVKRVECGDAVEVKP